MRSGCRGRRSTRSTGDDMFERFTKEARRVVVAAVEEAGRRGDTRVGTEHLLLGVFDSGWDRLSVLESSGLTDQALRLQLDAMEDQALQAVGIDRRSIDAGLAGSPPPARRRRHLPFTGGGQERPQRCSRRGNRARASLHRHRAHRARSHRAPATGPGDPSPEGRGRGRRGPEGGADHQPPPGLLRPVIDQPDHGSASIAGR